MNKRQLDDWLERYLELTTSLESPLQYNVWSGISAIASCLQRKCYTNWGLRGYVYPNLYIALVGPPGGRKGTAMRPAKNMLEECEVQFGSDSLGSSQVLYKEIIGAAQEYTEHDGTQKGHKSLNFWSEEFAVFLSDKDPRFINSITDLFDNPNNWKYNSLAQKTMNVSNCWLNIIGAITPSLLQARLSMESIGGGLVSRIIFVVGNGASKLVALPFLSPEEELLQETLIQDLQQIKLLTGPFVLSTEFLKAWVKWYETRSFNEGIDDEKFQGYNSRRALHINKLCMIFSASESNEMIITKLHFKKAVALLEDNEYEMPNAFYGVGRGAHSETMTAILRYVEKKKSFTFNELSTAFQLEAFSKDMHDYIDSLERSGKIKANSSTSSTRYDVIDTTIERKVNSLLVKTLYRRLNL